MNNICPFCNTKFQSYKSFLKCYNCTNKDVIVCKGVGSFELFEVVFQKHCQRTEFLYCDHFIRCEDKDNIYAMSYSFDRIKFSVKELTVKNLLNKLDRIIALSIYE